jgi:dTDP-4-amino-4,6-dideoxygalactose transaminase
VSVPLLDLRPQYEPLRDAIRAAIDEVVESQRFILGPVVTAFEREASAYIGSPHALGVSSGTDALLLALMAIDTSPGDDVVTTPFTFFATAGVVARLGARPVFVDIEPDSFNIDPAGAAAAIGPNTRAVLPVHLFGRCADLDPVLEAAAAQGVPVIEDAAQAIGARDAGGRSAGTIGAVGCFSFFPSKNLGAFGDAGLVTAADAGLADRMEMLRVHGGRPKYHHALVGGNFRIDALQAAVLRVKLPHLDAWTAGRRRNADTYRALFADAGLLDGRVTLPADVPGHIYNQFTVRVAERDALREYLAGAGIGTEVYYPIPLHLQVCFRSLGHAPGDFPAAERAAAEVLSLPIYPELGEPQLREVVTAIRGFYDARARG